MVEFERVLKSVAELDMKEMITRANDIISEKVKIADPYPISEITGYNFSSNGIAEFEKMLGLVKQPLPWKEN